MIGPQRRRFLCTAMLAVPLAGLGLVSSCSWISGEKKVEQRLKRVSHSNGFSVEFDEAAWSAAPTANGFHFTHVGAASMRTPPSLRLELQAEGKPSGEFSETIERDGKTVHLRRESGEAGSGGAEHRLSAWTALGKGYALVSASQQSETGRPGFEDALAVLVSAK